jgi:hypothetical protein
MSRLYTRFGEPERVKRSQRVSRLNDSDPVNTPLRVSLDDIDANPLAAEREGRAEPADASAHDKNLHPAHPQRIARSKRIGLYPIPNLDSVTLSAVLDAVSAETSREAG